MLDWNEIFSEIEKLAMGEVLEWSADGRYIKKLRENCPQIDSFLNTTTVSCNFVIDDMPPEERNVPNNFGELLSAAIYAAFTEFENFDWLKKTLIDIIDEAKREYSYGI